MEKGADNWTSEFTFSQVPNPLKPEAVYSKIYENTSHHFKTSKPN